MERTPQWRAGELECVRIDSPPRSSPPPPPLEPDCASIPKCRSVERVSVRVCLYANARGGLASPLVDDIFAFVCPMILCRPSSLSTCPSSSARLPAHASSDAYAWGIRTDYSSPRRQPTRSCSILETRYAEIGDAPRFVWRYTGWDGRCALGFAALLLGFALGLCSWALQLGFAIGLWPQERIDTWEIVGRDMRQIWGSILAR